MVMPPPCQHCGRARLSTGICPHCEHILCSLCNVYMKLIEFSDHVWTAHRAGPAVRARSTYLFWWEARKGPPPRCPECGFILNADGDCPQFLEKIVNGVGCAAAPSSLREDW